VTLKKNNKSTRQVVAFLSVVVILLFLLPVEVVVERKWTELAFFIVGRMEQSSLSFFMLRRGPGHG
jgi:hypothetical protein